jgi:hypothetical protein
MARQSDFKKELAALGTVLDALGSLEETQQKFVLTTAIERLGLSGLNVPDAAARGGDSAGNSTTAGTRSEVSVARDTESANAGTRTTGSTPTAKDFLRAKRPNTEVQRIAVLAYYLARYRDTPDFKTGDITKLNTAAAGARFSNAARFVDNATRAAHFLAPAGKGKKQITAHGEEVVEALPDQEKVKATMAAYRPSGRRGGTKRTSKRKRS